MNQYCLLLIIALVENCQAGVGRFFLAVEIFSTACYFKKHETRVFPVSQFLRDVSISCCALGGPAGWLMGWPMDWLIYRQARGIFRGTCGETLTRVAVESLYNLRRISNYSVHQFAQHFICFSFFIKIVLFIKKGALFNQY